MVARKNAKASPVSLGDLIPDPENLNKGTERGRKAVKSSIEQCRYGRPILAGKDGVVLAGNKTLEASIAIDGEDAEAIVVESDAQHLVIHQRMDLSLGETPSASLLALADNRAGQLGLEWDVLRLHEQIQKFNFADFVPADFAVTKGKESGNRVPKSEIPILIGMIRILIDAERVEGWLTDLGEECGGDKGTMVEEVKERLGLSNEEN